jgi:hypothetical protein
MITHPIELLACAIATQEGWFVRAALPFLRNNPGDLTYAGQVGASRVSGSPIAAFSSPALGLTALFRQLWLQVAQGQTVTEIIYQWAPPAANNSAAYLADVLAWTGLPADVPVLSLLPPLTQLNTARLENFL